ncbi:lig_chan-Glu_bd domain-containing protein [Nephila pilipes]|uniref:Lig_chan-Glu_bd domain-containing protein n=1 Tax=Nephila pilipes TaxID=299642 RepID=A0A8X6PIZ3_NEPPI|nr:lig_chan-Glu_bd domain-containing protein [Nephila pilipes]
MKTKRKLTVAAVNLPHIFEMNRSEDGHFEISGFEAKHLQVVLSALDVDYELVEPSEGEYGVRQPNGTWTGVIGMVQRGEADITSTCVAVTHERRESVDFSRSFLVFGHTFTIANPGREHSNFAYLYPFNLTTWLYILCALFFVSVIFFAINRSKVNRKISLNHIFLYTFGNLVKQPLVLNKELLNWKWFLCFWFAFVTLISFGYCACLNSFLTVPFQRDTIKTFRQLSLAVKKGTHRVFAPRGSFITSYLLTSPETYLRNIGKAIDGNSWYFPLSVGGSADYITENSVVLDSRALNELFYGSNGKFIVSSDNAAIIPIAYVLRKKFCCTQKLNVIVSRFAESGLMDKFLADSSMKFWLSTSKEVSETTETDQLSVKNLFGTFMLLLIGISCSFIVLLFEILFYNFVCHKKIVNFEIL